MISAGNIRPAWPAGGHWPRAAPEPVDRTVEGAGENIDVDVEHKQRTDNGLTTITRCEPTHIPYIYRGVTRDECCCARCRDRY